MNIVDGSSGAITAANTAKDGTGTPNFVVSPKPDDVYIDRLVFAAIGSNVATVARVFINNGLPHATAANNRLFAELPLAATTLDEAAAFVSNVLVMDLWLPAGYRLNVLLGTAVAAGYVVTAVGGEYQYG